MGKVNSDEILKCPNCGEAIPLTQVLRDQIEQKMKDEFNEKYLRLKDTLEKDSNLQIDKLNKKFEKEKESWENDKEKIEEQAKKNAENKISIELLDLKRQLLDKEQKLKDSNEKELEYLKKMREVDDKEKNIELEIERKLSEERRVILEKTEKQFEESYILKQREKDELINTLKVQISDLQRKAELGSQQRQGEVLEIEIEELLKTNFTNDRIEPVPKGVKGADITQKVYNNLGQLCGTIIWESKRTKSWSDGWIDKLKNDQREVNANIAVLVTTVLPKEINGFAFLKGIWVTNYDTFLPLTTALRIMLLQEAAAKQASVGVNDKAELLYDYVTNVEFKQRVEAIVEGYISMYNDLNSEKRSMEKIWEKRKKQIEKGLLSTAKMYGAMQGIITTLPEINNLELKSLTDGSSE